MPIHLRAEPGDYAPDVLCPGDPLRAKYIAETFFDPGARQVNAERGMLGYTGTFDGKPISVQSTGMGCPSAGIVFEELIMLGATRLVRVGTCGGLGDGMAMGDTVIGAVASSDDQTPFRYAQMTGYAPSATFSTTVMVATSLTCWNVRANPRLAITLAGWPVMVGGSGVNTISSSHARSSPPTVSPFFE